MQKEELLHLHMLMVQIKKYYESVSGNTVPTEEYDASPQYTSTRIRMYTEWLS